MYLSMSVEMSSGRSASSRFSTVFPSQKGRIFSASSFFSSAVMSARCVEVFEIAFYPARLVFGKERRALQLRGAASDHKLVVPDDDADVVQDMFQREAHAGKGMLLPVELHRLGEIPGPLHADLLVRVDDPLSEALHAGGPDGRTDCVLCIHTSLLFVDGGADGPVGSVLYVRQRARPYRYNTAAITEKPPFYTLMSMWFTSIASRHALGR